MGTVGIDTYENTSIAVWLHELPHKDWDFEDVLPMFAPQEKHYQQAIIAYSFVGISFALVTVLFLCCRCCWPCLCKCIKSSYAKSFKTKRVRPNRIIYTFIAAAVMVTAGNLYGYLANNQINEGVTEIIDAVNAMMRLKNDNIVSIESTATELRAINVTAGTVEDDLTALQDGGTIYDPTGSVAQAIQNSKEQLQQVQTTVLDAATDVDGQVGEFNKAEIDTDVADVVEHNRWLGQLVLLSFISLPFIMTLWGLWCKNKSILLMVSTVALITCSIGWIITAVETSGVVATGDLCYDPDDYLSNRVEIDDKAKEYVRYYVVCEGLDNPLQDASTSADTAVNQSRVAIDELMVNIGEMRQYNPSSADLDALESSAYLLGNETERMGIEVDRLVNQVLVCNQLHNIYVDAMRGLCHRTLAGFFVLVWIQGGTAFLTFIAVMCATALRRYYLEGALDDNLRSMDRLSFLYTDNDQKLIGEGGAHPNHSDQTMGETSYGNKRMDSVKRKQNKAVELKNKRLSAEVV